MSYGLNIYRADGNLTWTSDGYSNPIYAVQTFTVATANGTYWEYPALTGATIATYLQSTLASTYLTVSYPGGVPRVTFNTNPDYPWQGTFFCCFYVAVVAPPSGTSHGIAVQNKSNLNTIDNYSGHMSYVGAYSTVWWDETACGCVLAIPETFSKIGWKATVPKSQCPSPPMVFVDLPGYPNVRSVGNITEDATNWYPVVYSTLANPTVYVFTHSSSITAPDDGRYGMRVYGAAGQVLLDLTHHKPLALSHPFVKPSIYEPYGTTVTGAFGQIYNTDQTYSVQDTLPTNSLIGNSGRRIIRYMSPSYCKLSYDLCEYHIMSFGKDSGNLRTKLHAQKICPTDGYGYCPVNSSYENGWDWELATNTTTPWYEPLLIVNRDYYV